MKQTPMFLMLLLATAMSGVPGSDGSRTATLDNSAEKKRNPQQDAAQAEDAASYGSQHIRPAA